MTVYDLLYLHLFDDVECVILDNSAISDKPVEKGIIRDLLIDSEYLNYDVESWNVQYHIATGETTIMIDIDLSEED